MFTERELRLLASMFSLLANGKRLEILQILSKNEVNVGQLARMTQLSQSALSQHLAKMRHGNLVQFRRDRQTIYYRCDDADIERMLAFLHDLVDNPTLFPRSSSIMRKKRT